MAIPASIDAAPPVPGSPPAAPTPNGLWGKDGFSFGDLLDIVNPLQHIPVVSWAYRAITGDEIAPAAKLAGGGLFGGFAGLALGLADAAVTEATGKGPAELTMAWLDQPPAPGVEAAAPTQFAAAEPPPAPGPDPELPAVSGAEDALLLAAFGGAADAGGGTLLPPAMPLPADQAALLLASLGIPEAAKEDPAARRAQTDQLEPDDAAGATAAPQLPASPAAAMHGENGLARTQFLAVAAAAGEDIRALFGVP